MRALKLHELSLADRLADLAVDALIDEADLSPKPALVDRRGNGAHSDLHLGLMHASALSLWPMFKEMAEAAIECGEVGLPLREALRMSSKSPASGAPPSTPIAAPRPTLSSRSNGARCWPGFPKAAKIGRASCRERV